MIITTTPSIEGKTIKKYYGVVCAETIIGANIFKDFCAELRDIFGGRTSSYENVLREGKETSLRELEEEAEKLGANALIGIHMEYETVGPKNSMLMINAYGTAVEIE